MSDNLVSWQECTCSICSLIEPYCSIEIVLKESCRTVPAHAARRALLVPLGRVSSWAAKADGAVGEVV